MNKVKRFLSWPKRRWRTLGFGIHSPFAYEFLTTVVCEKYNYYNYDRLEEIESPIPFKYLALIFRCICFFKPRHICIIGQSETMRLVAGYADSRCLISDRPDTSAGFFIIADQTEYASFPIPDGSVVIMPCLSNDRSVDFWKQVCRDMDHGMTFDDDNIGIACLFNHLPRQSFKIAF